MASRGRITPDEDTVQVDSDPNVTAASSASGDRSDHDETRAERRRVAEARVRRAMWFGGAAGVLPLPLVDLALITGVQVTMIADLSDLYGVPFSENAVKASVASLIGGVVPVSGLASGSASLVKAVPLIGPLVGLVAAPVYAAATTWAVGRVFIAHFESGGTLLDFDADKFRDRFRREFESARGKASAA